MAHTDSIAFSVPAEINVVLVREGTATKLSPIAPTEHVHGDLSRETRLDVTDRSLASFMITYAIFYP